MQKGVSLGVVESENLVILGEYVVGKSLDVVCGHLLEDLKYLLIVVFLINEVDVLSEEHSVHVGVTLLDHILVEVIFCGDIDGLQSQGDRLGEITTSSTEEDLSPNILIEVLQP
jgi:hypothetical protein